MTESNSLPQFYSSLLKFLVIAKHSLIASSKVHDMSVMQTITLLLTEKDKPKPMNSFQKLFNCDASNITGIIDGLEEKGLVSRGEQPDDRRVKIILITEKGLSLQKLISKDLIKIDDEILSPLSSTEMDQFRTIIIKLSGTTLV